MNLLDYQQQAIRTLNPDLTTEQRLANAALGIASEGGEVVNLLKQYLFQGHTLDLAQLNLEIGDVLWYLALLCDTLHLDLEDAAQQNLAKLRNRYPDRFTAERSIHREPALG